MTKKIKGPIKTTNLPCFGDNLEYLIQEKGVSVRKCSNDTKIPYKSLSAWVGNGGRIPRNLEHIKVLAKYFNVTTHYLLFGEQEQGNCQKKFTENGTILLDEGRYEIKIRKL